MQIPRKLHVPHRFTAHLSLGLACSILRWKVAKGVGVEEVYPSVGASLKAGRARQADLEWMV